LGATGGGADGDGGFVLGTANGGVVAAAGVAGGAFGRTGMAGDGDAAGVDVAGAGFCVEAGGGSGGCAIGWDVTGGVTGVTVPRAMVRAAAPGSGFVGAVGASSRMISDKPTNPIATAAPPYRSMVLSVGVPRDAGRG
jgi:hypothetical protein